LRFPATPRTPFALLTVARPMLKPQPWNIDLGAKPMRHRVREKLNTELMPNKNDPRRHDETFKRAAVDYLQKTGSTVEDAAAELGIDPADLRTWSKKVAAKPPPAKNLTGIAQLKAENQALRNEVLHLQVQWDILKTTLGILSTTVGTQEPV
jgi:transposase-like protein